MKDAAQLKKLGIFKKSDAISLGCSSNDFAAFAANGEVIKLERGVYHHRDFVLPPDVLGYAIACARFGSDAVIGGLSALAYYNLTEVVPRRVWMIVPVNKQTTDLKYRFLQTKKDLGLCINKEKHFKVVNLERAIVEGLYYATKVGLDNALHAASIALGEKQTTIVKLSNVGQKLGYEAVLKKHWQTLQAIQKAS